MRTQTDADDAQKEHAQKDQISACAARRRALAAERARVRGRHAARQNEAAAPVSARARYSS